MDANDGKRGYIMARTVEKNGRPVAFVYKGKPPEKDGNDAIAEGFAYATYYRGLFHDLRDALTDAVIKARSAKLGVYKSDKTNKGFDASSLQSITYSYSILPKLFRRLSEYMVNYGTSVGFSKKMAQSKERVLDMTNSNFTHFDTFIKQDEDSTKIRLTRDPEQLVFDEMPARPSNAFSAIMGSETAQPPRFIETVTLPEDAIRDMSL